MVLVACVVAVSLHPSALGVVAFVVLGVVSCSVEAAVWVRLRQRWDRGVKPESVGKLLEPNRRRDTVLAFILLVAAIAFKTFGYGGDTVGNVIVVVAIAGMFGSLLIWDVIKKRL